MIDRPSRNQRCRECGFGTRSTTGICRDCTPRDDRKPCLMCRAITKAADRHCSACMVYIDSVATERVDAKDGLSAGAWVPAGGIVVWRAAS